jgi:predicted NBD/HSP70 family sugar kinase
MFAPNLGWGGVDLAALLEAEIKLPVVLENAANACALAELWFGRHPEHVRHIVAITVSEGIGVGLLLNGQLVHGCDSMAGEFGHVTFDENGPLCPCGKRGCWERYASNSAATQYYAALTSGADGDQPPSTHVPRFEELVRYADNGDGRAVEALERMARFLGIGLAGLAMGLAPEVMVIVGDVTATWDRVGPIVSEEVRKRTLPQAPVRIVPTDPATQPRLRGAVTLVVQQHFGAPTVA